MKNDILKVFLGGDVFGPVGMRCASRLLPAFIVKEEIDFCVINGENASNGIGLSPEDADLLFNAGADVITGGNHSFEKRDYWQLLSSSPRVLRPANFPDASPEANALPLAGSGLAKLGLPGYDLEVAVLNVQGREDMVPIDCPFRAAREAVSAWNSAARPPIILVDVHAESSQEKEALALYLDGKVSAVCGTHTHVQTADERILPGGTAYITDLGMIGPQRSVIGSDPATAIKRNITQVLYRMELPDVPGSLRGLLVEIDVHTRKAVSVSRIDIRE
jgi:hypothetical protein